MGGILNTTLCDQVCQSFARGLWFSLDTLVSSNSKTDRHDITKILLKVMLNTINYNFFELIRKCMRKILLPVDYDISPLEIQN